MLTFKEKLIVTMLLLVAGISLVVWVGFFYFNLTRPIAKAGGEYVEGIVGQPIYINPILSQTSEADSDLTQLVYSGLFKYNKDGIAVPDIAAGYEVSGDQKEYTIHLRKGVKWHDGKDLTAGDAVFTYNVLGDPAYKSPLRQSWQGVDVVAPDDYTVVFSIQNPYMGFLDNLTVGLLPKHIWENIAPEKFALADYNLHPVGSGPFMLTDFQKDSSGNILTLHLNAFKNFYEGKAYISKLTFNFYPDEDALIAGYNKKEIMGMGSIAPEKINNLKNAKSTQLLQLAIPRYFSVFFNQTKSVVLAHDEVRQALSKSIDRQAIIKDVLNNKGIPLASPFSPQMIGYDQETNKTETDVAEANKILEDAGWVLDSSDNVRKKAGVSLEFEMVTTDWPELSQTAQLLKDQWAKIGIKVNVKVLAISDLQQNYIRTREYDSLLFGQAITFNPDLYSFWHSSQKRDPGLNLSLFDNKDADALLEGIRQDSDLDKRVEDYKKLQAIMAKENPAVFLYGQSYLYPVNVSVHGIDVQNINAPSQRFVDINKWYVKTSRVLK